GDVCLVDRRVAVHSALNVMDSVAVVARRSDDETHFQQRAAMDAVHVLRGRLRIFHLILLGQAGITMAARAGAGEIEFEDRGVSVLCGGYVMEVDECIGVVERMTVNAVRCARRSELMAYAMNAGRVFLGLRF